MWNRPAIAFLAVLVLSVWIADHSWAAGPRADARKRSAAELHSIDVRAFHHDGSRMTAPRGGNGQVAGDLLQSWSFEPSPAIPAFSLGPVNGQHGWAAFSPAPGGNELAPAVSSQCPSVCGSQWIDIVAGPLWPGTYNGPLSPDMGPQPPGDYVVSVRLRISNIGGADYSIVPQAPSQGLIACNMRFFFDDFDLDGKPGDILVIDGPPWNLAWVNTGANWTPGEVHVVRIELDSPEIRYYLDSVLIHTGSAFGATAVEQVVFPSDNFQLPDEKGQIDQLHVSLGLATEDPPCLPGAPCVVPNPADLNNDGHVNTDDLILLITTWGACPALPAACPADIQPIGLGDGFVNTDDLILLITNWG